MLERARFRWAAWRTDPEQSDAELATATGEVVTAVVQTAVNRSMGRPSLSSSSPLESALEQRAYDRETLERYRERIAPEIDALRREYVARGRWSPALDARYREPEGLDDLRAVAVALARRAEELDAGKD